MYVFQVKDMLILVFTPVSKKKKKKKKNLDTSRANLLIRI